MKNVFKKSLSIIVAVIVSCYTTVFAFASSNAHNDIIGYYDGVDNPQAVIYISGFSNTDDDIFVSAYYSTLAGGYIVGYGRTSYIKGGSYCFSMPKVKMCESNGANPSGNFINTTIYGVIIRETSFFNTTIYLSEGDYRYRKV